MPINTVSYWVGKYGPDDDEGRFGVRHADLDVMSQADFDAKVEKRREAYELWRESQKV